MNINDTSNNIIRRILLKMFLTVSFNKYNKYYFLTNTFKEFF